MFVSCVCFLPVLNAQADVPAAEEWVDIPVVVNIIDASDASNVDDAIKKANEILKQAHIRLVVKKTNNNVNVGNGDPNLTEAEGDTAQEDGQKELDKVCGAGKGIKITVADDCWTEDPNTVAWSIHRNPVIIIEPDADANEMGETITHELLHSLTVTAHSNDVNDVMYPTEAGNGIINPNDVNEIFPNAKKRGKPYFIVPRVLPGRPVAIPAGIDYSIDIHGAILDSFFDVFCEASSFDPCDPNFGYADLREISIFSDCDNGLLIPGTVIYYSIQLGGDFPADSFFDVFMDTSIDYDPVPDIDAMIHMHIWGNPYDPNIYTEATFENLKTGEVNDLELIVHENHKFDGSEGPILDNHSLEVPIPADFFGPGSDPFDGIIYLSSNAHDERLGMVPMIDDAEGFAYGPSKGCGDPQVCFVGSSDDGGEEGLFGIFGSGFPPNTSVNVWLDGELLGTTETDIEGSVTSWWSNDTLEDGMRACQLSAELIDPTEPDSISYVNAIGYFVYCPGGEVEGDLDGDCDVDLHDFAKLANNWLAGKEPEP